MTDIAEKWFNGVDLGYYGLVTPKVSGLDSPAKEEMARTWVPGRSNPNDVPVRCELEDVVFGCVVVEDTPEELCRKLGVLRGLMSSRLGWCELKVPARRLGLRTFARSLGFPVSIDSLPYDRCDVEFDWKLERYGWWEDENPRTLTDPASINNTGDLDAYPTYTCTVTDTLADGLYFQVGSDVFTYEGALANEDVLVVETDLPNVLLNGTRDFGNTASAAQFPALSPGANAVTKSSTDFTLGVSFRRRFE
ncbi:MAG: phage tail family protein [Thermoleophilia bacterium]|nr:phage tail family protein [Thermoleophilia bacterium]